MKHIVLGRNRGIVDYLDSASGVVEGITANGIFQNGEWRIIKHKTTTYQSDRVVCDCLAFRTGRNTPAAGQ